MEYRQLGDTGLALSAISLGCSSFGGVFHSYREHDALDVVMAAIDAGINYMDVSPYYGYYKAEEVLGTVFPHIPRDKFLISTKVGRYGENGHNVWDYSASRASRSVYESMERMHLDYIDMVFVHDIEFADLRRVADETLPALLELKRQGVIGHVGCTDLQLENLRWIIEHTEPGTVEVVLNFCHYTLNDDKLLDFLDFFEDHHVGVINASPFAMGLLTRRGIPQWHPAPRPLVEACRRAADLCHRHQYPIEKLAMQFATSCPRIATTVFSTTSVDNLMRNIRYVGEDTDRDLLREVMETIGSQRRVSWKNT